MLRLPDHWIWDSWPIDDGVDHHLFFLKAPRHIGDPDLRHHNSTVGHAVSTDHAAWRLLPDALGVAPPGRWDDFSIWTGSVVRGDAGTWHLFYTARSRVDGGLVQRIGRADSADLVGWQRYGDEPLVEADPRWYETLADRAWPEVTWRDPWVLRDPAGDGWHMLVTARIRAGPPLERGVLGHAWSADLHSWAVQPPLSGPAGFGQLEVPQVTTAGGRAVLLFGCLAPELAPRRRQQSATGGVWSAPAATLLGPFDLDRAEPFPDPTLYAAHLVGTGPGRHGLLGFTNMVDEAFVGAIPPPTPVRLSPVGVLLPADPLTR